MNKRQISTDPLLLRTARALVNSEKWAEKLDEFFPNKPGILRTIQDLLGRTASESEEESILRAVDERFKLLQDINNIRVAFSIPENKEIKILLAENNKIDLSSTFESLIEYFNPDLSKLDNFSIILRLKYFDLAKNWLNAVLTQEDIDVDYFVDNIIIMFSNALKADYSFIHNVIIPINILEDFSYRELYCALFMRLVMDDAKSGVIIEIWRRISADQQAQLLTDTLNKAVDLDLIWSFVIIVFPEDWQDYIIYRNIYFLLFLKASQEPRKYMYLLCNLANIVEDDLSILYEALERSCQESEDNFLKIVNIFILSLHPGIMQNFISDNLIFLLEQWVIDNDVEILEKIWGQLSDYHHQEIKKWLNENHHYILNNEEMADFILRKLSLENQQEVIVRSISCNLENCALVRGLFHKMTIESKEAVKKNCEKAKPNLYDRYWHYYLEEPGLEEKINDISKSLEFMFGTHYAEQYAKYFSAITTCITLLKNTPDVFKDKWSQLTAEAKDQFCGPLLYCFFNEMKDEDCAVIDFLMASVSKKQALDIEKEIQWRQKMIDSTYAFAYWVEKYASAEFVANLDGNDIDSLVGYVDGNLLLTAKVLKALYQYNRLDRLQLNMPERYTNLILCGSNILFLPYIIKGYISSLPIDHNNNEVVARDVYSVLNTSFPSLINTNTSHDDTKNTHAFNRAKRIFFAYICSLLLNQNEKSLEKLHYFSAALINCTNIGENNNVKIFSLLIIDLLSNRKDNPMLEGSKDLKPGFFTLRNPIDEHDCRSDNEKDLIILFTELKNLFPEHFTAKNVSHHESVNPTDP